MLGDFSSYIEFLSAVYVTTCLNNDLFKKFWSPNFYVGFNNILSEFRFEGSSILFKNIGDIIRKKHEIIEDSGPRLLLVQYLPLYSLEQA